jgi:CRISPR-associated protein Csd2
VLLFDVADGNPNGDPDDGNLPRHDPETLHGLVTDGAIKRKIRNWVDLAYGDRQRHKIYVQDHGVALNDLHERAYMALGITSRGAKQPRDDVDRVRRWMVDNFFDIRTFGAVMATSVNAGRVVGPVQITMARSIDPILPLSMTITRVAVTTATETSGQDSDMEADRTRAKFTQFGRKTLVPYALYRCYIFVNPQRAAQVGFDPDDLAILWRSVQVMWDIDRSAARGLMACRGLYVFSHESPLGNAPAQALLERVRIHRLDPDTPPRQFGDYRVTVDGSDLPSGIVVSRLLG